MKTARAWHDYPDHHLAEQVCTPRELTCLKLNTQGFGYRLIAGALGISVSTVRDKIKNAERKITNAKQEAA
jgi:DNA-binding CsgD family transcriptional regulator